MNTDQKRDSRLLSHFEEELDRPYLEPGTRLNCGLIALLGFGGIFWAIILWYLFL